MNAVRLLLSALAVLAAIPAAAQAPQRSAPSGQPSRDAAQVAVRNEGEITLYELYIARGGTGARNWGPDRLGDRVLEAGREITLRLGQNFGCLADLRLVYEDGAEEIRERVDLCRERIIIAARVLPMEERSFTVRNRTGLMVIQLFGRSMGEQDWGPDRLGNDVLEDGAEMTISIPSRGCEIDLMVVYVDNRAVEERRGIDACDLAELTLAPGWLYAENPAAFRPGNGAGPRITLINRSGRTVFTVHVFPDGAPDEGPDRLGADTLSDGATLDLALDPAPDCRYTVRVTYHDSAREERRGIDFCRQTELAIAPGWVDTFMGSVRFINAGAVPVIALHLGEPGAPLAPDALGAGTIGRGEAATIILPDPKVCTYEVRAFFRDGRTIRIPPTDLCTAAEIVLSP